MTIPINFIVSDRLAKEMTEKQERRRVRPPRRPGRNYFIKFVSMTKWFSFVVLIGYMGLSYVAEAQTIDFSRRLADQLPTPALAPTSMTECSNLDKRWANVQRQIIDAHQQCLDTEEGKRSSRKNPGGNCTFATCEHLHNLMNNRQLSDMRRAQASACRKAVRQYLARNGPQSGPTPWQDRGQSSRPSRSRSVLGRGQPSDRPRYFPQPWENPWEPPQSAARPHLSDEQKADLERTIEHWVNLPARRREEFRRLTEISDEEWEALLNLGNPIDGRHPLSIALGIMYHLDQWMKRRLATANRRERRQMCQIWFPRGINLPSSCR